MHLSSLFHWSSKPMDQLLYCQCPIFVKRKASVPLAFQQHSRDDNQSLGSCTGVITLHFFNLLRSVFMHACMDIEHLCVLSMTGYASGFSVHFQILKFTNPFKLVQKTLWSYLLCRWWVVGTYFSWQYRLSISLSRCMYWSWGVIFGFTFMVQFSVTACKHLIFGSVSMAGPGVSATYQLVLNVLGYCCPAGIHLAFQCHYRLSSMSVSSVL